MIKNQNRFFFHAILNVMYEFQNGMILSHHFLFAFLNIIQTQTIENKISNEYIIHREVGIIPNIHSGEKLVGPIALVGKSPGIGSASANTGISFFVKI